MGRTIVLGRGFLGKEFEADGYEVWDRKRFNADSILWGGIFRGVETIINCIAVSDTRYCERPENFAEVMKVNAGLPGRLSFFCRKTGRKFVHISTGCVYGDSERMCFESDPVNDARSAYARSKLAAEGLCHHSDLIIRPRLLLGAHEAPGNLLDKLLKFDKFLDERNSVTWTRTIVEAVGMLLDYRKSGIYNVANEGACTIREMAAIIGREGGALSGEEVCKMQGVHVANNVMSVQKLKEFYQPPTVEQALFACMRLRNLPEASGFQDSGRGI